MKLKKYLLILAPALVFPLAGCEEKTNKNWNISLDPLVQNEVGLECGRKGNSLNCLATNKLSQKLNLSNLRLVCYKNNVQVYSKLVYANVDPNGSTKFSIQCNEDFDLAAFKLAN